MKRTLFTYAALGMSLLGGFLVPQVKADDWDKKTVVSISESVDVAGTVLAPGRYTFKVMDNERNIVLIYNDDEGKFVAAIPAIPASHLERSGRSEFTFAETAAGQALALQSWFYPGSVEGLEFPVSR